MTGWKGVLAGSMASLVGLLLVTAANAQDTESRLLNASEGLQMPGSEADSAWWFVSYPGEDELPTVERFSELTGCDYPEGGVSRSDFDATLDHLGDVQPWMDRGQRKSARGFARLQRLFHRRYEELAVYRCETGTAEVRVYFVGLDEEGLSGLMSINIETQARGVRREGCGTLRAPPGCELPLCCSRRYGLSKTGPGKIQRYK